MFFHLLKIAKFNFCHKLVEKHAAIHLENIMNKLGMKNSIFKVKGFVLIKLNLQQLRFVSLYEAGRSIFIYEMAKFFRISAIYLFIPQISG